MRCEPPGRGDARHSLASRPGTPSIVRGRSRRGRRLTLSPPRAYHQDTQTDRRLSCWRIGMRARKKGAFIVAGVVVCLGLVLFFVLLARQVQGDTSLTRFDTELGEKLGVSREAVPFFRIVLMAFTLLGSQQTLMILVPLGGVIFWV